MCCLFQARARWRPFASDSPLTVVCYLVVSVLFLVCGVSMTDCSWVLKGFSAATAATVHVVAEALPGIDTQPLLAQLISDIPTDIRTVTADLQLKPTTEAYVCCPKCFACYPIDAGSPYPDRCTNDKTASGKMCKRRLRKTRTIKGKLHTFPSRRFLYHRLDSWIADLLCRPGMEDVLDCYLAGKGDGATMEDIRDAEILREFKGPDGRRFVRDDGKGGRYVFTLSIDGFNPYHNMEAGKKASSSAIYMICLNLPPHLRHRVENMFLVGIIPGPNEPNTMQLNHILQPLIRDLLEFWDPGVHYSKTPNYPLGRTINCALVPLICDLKAARTTMGWANYNSALNFCSICQLPLEDINRVDVDNWERRTWQQHKVHAAEWEAATSEDARRKLFTKHGVRSSVLLKLPYWDPTRYVLIETMHALFLGNFRRLCRVIWDMNIELEDGDGIGPDILPPNKNWRPMTEEELLIGAKLFRSGDFEALKECRVPILQQLCRETSTLPPARHTKSKKHLVKALNDYVGISSFY